MTKADLIEEVSRVVEMTRKESEVIVEAIFDSIVRSLRTGDKIEIRGFGSFRTRQRQPRIGRNPKTGARVEVPAKKIPYFKPSKELKDVVNNSARRRRRSPPARRPSRFRTRNPRAGPAWIISGLPGGISTSPGGGRRASAFSAPPRRSPDDRDSLVVHRGAHNFVILNRFPYTNGHVMVVPYAHVATLEDLPDETLVEMMRLARDARDASARRLPAGRSEPGMNLARAPAPASPATCTCTCCRAGPATPIS